ncbi:hypothetical protein E4U14_003437 [Claviceps sp. LM454 group G7]|nr:hypothetical protein E4U14_003437 [Claviceps sp. LM454 group G7]
MDGLHSACVRPPPYNCPWVPNSPWSQSRKQLEHGRQVSTGGCIILKIQSPVAVHLTLGYVETFVHLNLYVLKCPRVNLGRGPDAKEHLETCLEYLEKYRHV